jgi:hypothetical protein
MLFYFAFHVLLFPIAQPPPPLPLFALQKVLKAGRYYGIKPSYFCTAKTSVVADFTSQSQKNSNRQFYDLTTFMAVPV